jgi:hypothetical protein
VADLTGVPVRITASAELLDIALCNDLFLPFNAPILATKLASAVARRPSALAYRGGFVASMVIDPPSMCLSPLLTRVTLKAVRPALQNGCIEYDREVQK